MTTTSSAAKQVPVTRVSAEQDRPLDRLRKFLETHGMKGKTGPRAFAEFERELHAWLMEFEREVIADEMRTADVDVPAIEINGKVHRVGDFWTPPRGAASAVGRDADDAEEG